MKYYNTLLIFVILIGVMTCSSEENNQKAVKKNKEPYVRYFREKRITTRNQFRHIYIRFEKEILGSPDEIEQSLKMIEKEKGSYYKVYYDRSRNVIIEYGFFQKGLLVAQAKYTYGGRDNPQKGKLVMIDYYDEELKPVASDTITYNKFGRPIQTQRSIMTSKGKRLLNIF